MKKSHRRNTKITSLNQLAIHITHFNIYFKYCKIETIMHGTQLSVLCERGKSFTYFKVTMKKRWNKFFSGNRRQLWYLKSLQKSFMWIGFFSSLSSSIFADIKRILKGFKIFTGLEIWQSSYDKFIPQTKVSFLTTSCNSCYKKIQESNLLGSQHAHAHAHAHAHTHTKTQWHHIIKIKSNL